MNTFAALAQLVEQGTENPCVLGSIPRRGKFFVIIRTIFVHKGLAQSLSPVQSIPKDAANFLL